MRRLVAALAAGLAVLASAPSAGAQFSQSFSSPTRAVAGAPMFVRSVTPCPATFGYVTVDILGQLDSAAGETTAGDVAADGSWVVTVTAPSDMGAGVTKSYLVRATCSDGGPTYGTRRLYVTGFGNEGAGDGDAVDTASAESGSAAAAVAPASVASVSSPLVKSVRAVEAQSVPAAVVAQSIEPETTTTTWVSDEAERAAEARAELARRTTRADDVTLSASPVVATTRRPSPDAGIPWWSFVLATMLAVGAVIGVGQRRRSAL